MTEPAPSITHEEQCKLLEKALPCPYCGNDFLYFKDGSVACDNCQTEGPFEGNFTDLDSYATAVENWNRRT